MNEPQITVGILLAPQINFVLNGTFVFDGCSFAGLQRAEIEDGKIRFNNNLFDEIIFEPNDDTSSSFDLKDVLIGIGFHWERKENQRFKGKLRIIIEDGKLRAINALLLEDYLISVISSEMSATASLELLKAHAVISRSWLLAQLEAKIQNLAIKDSSVYSSNTEYIRWYDKDDHANFDVCADDHCQRYQGISRACTPAVEQAVKATKGEVLIHEGKICDARFSKCCGGISELFENCWEPKHHDYLLPVEDKAAGAILSSSMSEKDCESFISNPNKEHFCNTSDAKILSQVLNNYDQETSDFYRWEILYSQQELSDLLRKRSGIDFGEIIDMQPIERGASGRLIKLKIVGTKQTRIVGKELEIRKWLSQSHLYSSAFVVQKENIQNNIPQTFKLQGAGWGHGVGLCQIGAAVMAEKDYLYQDILFHYFKNITLNKIY